MYFQRHFYKNKEKLRKYREFLVTIERTCVKKEVLDRKSNFYIG